MSFEDALWDRLQKVSGVLLSGSAEASTANNEILNEEIEALEAIFPECKVSADKPGRKTVSLELSDGALLLEVAIREGVYPTVKPERVWVTGKWGAPKIGSAAAPWDD